MQLFRYIVEQFIIISISLSCWGISRGKFSAYGRSSLNPRNSIDAAVTEALVRGLRSSSNSNNGAAYSNGYPSAFLGNQRSLPAVKIRRNGFFFSIQILKQQLANELKLPLRDLRVVDPSFPSQIQATFVARPTAILFCIENVKVIVRHDEVIIFGPTLPQVKEFIPALQQQIENSQLSSIDPFSNSNSSVRFEHVVLETALNVISNNLFMQVRRLSPSVAAALSALRAQSKGLDVIQTQVDELLPLKNKLDLLCKRVQVVKRAIMEVLNSDEDMAMMYLAGSQEVIYESNGHYNREYQDFTSNSAVEEFDIASEVGSTGVHMHSYAVSSSSSTEDSRRRSIDDDNSNSVNKSKNKNFDMHGRKHHERVNPIGKSVDTIHLEMLFETYLNEIEWIASEIEGLQDNITNT
eukprot:gene22485-29115_t